MIFFVWVSSALISLAPLLGWKQVFWISFFLKVARILDRRAWQFSQNKRRLAMHIPGFAFVILYFIDKINLFVNT